MTRLSKTALLAGGLTAALLMSAPLAIAATPAQYGHPQNSHSQNGYTKTAQRDQHNSNDRGKTYTNSRNDKNGHSRSAHKGNRKHAPRYAENGRRIFFLRYDRGRYGDRFHRPPVRAEYMGRAPHPGMRWQTGEWRWHNNHWVWVAGIWLLAAQLSHH